MHMMHMLYGLRAPADISMDFIIWFMLMVERKEVFVQLHTSHHRKKFPFGCHEIIPRLASFLCHSCQFLECHFDPLCMGTSKKVIMEIGYQGNIQNYMYR